MPRISTYTKDATIVDEDILLGSNYVRTYNGIKEYNTRSFKLEDLALYFNTKFTSASIDTNSITATELNISGNGSSGQFIISDGDGSFSYLSILDEDNMSSNSATAPASQQSIKAYVDSQIATEDTIAELNDTTIGTLANAHLLIYDNDSSVWENKALSGDATITKDGVISLASSHTNIDSILNASLAVGRDADNQIKYSTDNQIIFRVDGEDNVVFKGSGEIEATSLDISGDADIDGTLEADAITVDGTTLSEYIADTTGAMFTSNTETFITATYDDSDNTIDLVVPVKDEDNMASDSATHLATQQSIKAYVDAQVDTEDTLAELDDTNISSAAAGQILVYDNTASVWDNVALTAGDLIDVTGGDGTLEIDVDLTEAAEAAIANGDYMLFLDGGATGTPKKEALHDIATLFSGTGLTATNSVIAVDAAQTQITSVGTLAAGAISSGFGNIDNGSSTFNTGAATVDSLSVSDGNITNVGDIALDTISADGTTINVAMTDNTDGAFSVKQGSDKYIAIDTTDTGEDIAIGTGVSGTAITIGHTTSETTIQDNLTVTGNLKVNGDQVYQNVTSMAVSDPIISLQTGTDGANLGADSNKDVGLAMFWHNGSAAKTAFLGFDDSAGKLTFIPDASISSEVASGSVGVIVANLEGDVTGDITGDVTGTSSLVTVTDSTANTDFPVVFNNESNGLLDDTGAFEYNPSTGTLIVANLDIETNVDVNGTLEADAITVNGTALDTHIAGVTVTNATNSAHVLVTDNESTNEENLITFVEGATSSTGNVGLEMDGNLTYNPSTGTVTATGFSGNLTGTLQTAAQANVTSLGTLTTLTVDNVIINGTTIGHTDDTDLITLADGAATFAGNVGIKSAPVGNAGTNIISVGTAGSVAGGVQLWAGTGQSHFLQFGDESGTASNHYRGAVGYNHSSDTLSLLQSGTTALSFTGSQAATFAGRVFIGGGSGDWPTSTIGSSAGRSAIIGSDDPILLLHNTGSVAANTGSELWLTQKAASSSDTSDLTYTAGGVIKGYKDDANANALGYLRFDTTTTTGGVQEVLRLDSSKNATFAGDATVKGGELVINSESTSTATTDIDKIHFKKAHQNGPGTALYTLGEIRSTTNGGYSGGMTFYTGKNVGGGSYASTLAMTLDASQNATFGGNVAVGGGALKTYHSNVTSVIELDDQASIFTRANETYIGQNFYYDSGDDGTAIEAGKGTLMRLRRGEINMYFSAASASSADDTHSMQEKFTLTDAGDLTLYGDVNVNLNDTAANVTIISASGQYDDSDDAKSVFELKYYGQGAFHTHRVGSSWNSIIENPNSGGTMEWWINGGQKLQLGNSGNFGVGASSHATYRMLVYADTDGDWLVNFLNGHNGDGNGLLLDATDGSSGEIQRWRTYNGSLKARCMADGDFENANNSYGSTSDKKLKENIVDATPKLDDLCKVKIRNFNKIGEDTKQIGVIAQELEEIFPKMISESEDLEITEDGTKKLGTKTKSVKYSVFVPMLVKAVQEQQEIIEDLKKRIETLEK